MGKLVNRVRGEVRVRAESAFPERVLNLCGARELSFWDLKWESPTALSFRMTRQDFFALRRAAEKVECSFTLLERQGGPYVLRRCLSRPGLLAGLVACGLCLFLSSFFVWEFHVTGNTTVPTEKILRALEKNGVCRGSFGMGLDGEEIRNHVLLDLPELSWIAVNVSGCRAEVQVAERVLPPELPDRKNPANVVARRPGLVLEMQALRGARCVLPGTMVQEGELLISGVEDTDTVGAVIGPSLGKITARTWYTLETAVPLTAVEKRYTGVEKQKFSWIFGTHRVKFFANSSVEGADCDKINQIRPLSIFGIPLPLRVETETYRLFERVEVERKPETAERQTGEVLRAYLERLVEPYGTISSTLVSSRRRGDVLLVTLKAECREEIGERRPLYTEENSDGDAQSIQE